MIDIINQFWETHLQEPLPKADVVLFFFLLYEWEKRERPEWFSVESRRLEIAVPISRKTLMFSREQLRQKGLIDYKLKGGSGTTQYSICVTHSVSLRNTNGVVLHKETQQETQTQNNTQPPLLIPATMEAYSLTDIAIKLKGANRWKESIRRTYKLTEEELMRAIDDFISHCINIGETHKTKPEAKRHFTYWLLKQNNNETEREDRFSKRRGTDPKDNCAEDYTATL